MFTCVWSRHITQRCNNSPRCEMGLQSAGNVMHRKRAEDFWNLKKVRRVEMRPASGEDGWLLLACGCLGLLSHEMGGGRWKSQHRKIVPLSPYVEEPLNSKVIKSFIPELKSHKCFLYFEIPMFYVYIYEHYMSILRSHIYAYDYGTLNQLPIRRLESPTYLNIYSRASVWKEM